LLCSIDSHQEPTVATTLAEQFALVAKVAAPTEKLRRIHADLPPYLVAAAYEALEPPRDLPRVVHDPHRRDAG
jgi:hypothetical protein